MQILERTRTEMTEFLELLKKAEICEDAKNRYDLWNSCCEKVLQFEQYSNETPFIELKNTAEIVYGKKSPEFAESLHLYAEYLYTLYCGVEDPTKLAQSREFCEISLGGESGWI